MSPSDSIPKGTKLTSKCSAVEEEEEKEEEKEEEEEEGEEEEKEEEEEEEEKEGCDGMLKRAPTVVADGTSIPKELTVSPLCNGTAGVAKLSPPCSDPTAAHTQDELDTSTAKAHQHNGGRLGEGGGGGGRGGEGEGGGGGGGGGGGE